MEHRHLARTGALQLVAVLANINSSGNTRLHPDFGGGGDYGIPLTVVAANESKRRVDYTAYGDESDPGSCATTRSPRAR